MKSIVFILLPSGRFLLLNQQFIMWMDNFFPIRDESGESAGWWMGSQNRSFSRFGRFSFPGWTAKDSGYGGKVWKLLGRLGSGLIRRCSTDPWCVNGRRNIFKNRAKSERILVQASLQGGVVNWSHFKCNKSEDWRKSWWSCEVLIDLITFFHAFSK